MRRVFLAAAVALAVAAGLWLLFRHSPAPDSTATNRVDPAPPEAPVVLATATASSDGVTRDAGASVAPEEAGSANDADAEGRPDPDYPDVRVVTVDAVTGRPLPSTWNFGTGNVVAAPFPPGAVIDEAAVEAMRESVRRSVADWNAAFVPSGESRRYGVIDERYVAFDVTVRPPSGFVTLASPLFRVQSALATDVREALVVVPLFREVVLDLRVSGPDGQPAEGASLDALELSGEIRRVAWETVAPGEIRVRGLPWLAGEQVKAAIAWETGGDGDIVESALSETIESPDLAVAMPDVLPTPWTFAIRLEGPREPRFLAFLESDTDHLPAETRPVAAEGEPRCTVRLRALGRDGTPVAGATIEGETTDARGEVSFEDVPPGRRTFGFTAPRRLPGTATVDVRAGTETEVVLREPNGARLDVTVVDEHGRPRPWSSLVLLGLRHFDAADGVQRVDLLTDGGGRRSLARVEPGEGTVVASFAGRRGNAPVTLRDGGRRSVQVVVR